MKSISKEELFKRQITLSEIGGSGQQKLQSARIVIIGCGGLGTIAASYLAGSGIGSIFLVDFDVIDISNLHRQIFYRTLDVGKPKAEVLASYLKNIAPFTKVTYSKQAVSKQNVFQIIEESDIVLDCTDSLPIKYLINDACVLKHKTMVYGSLYKFDGYVATFNAITDSNYSANLRDAFPEISKEVIPNCSEIGTMNTIVGIIGLLQANEVLKLITGIGKPLVNELLIYNSLENSQFRMKLKRSFTQRKIKELFESEYYYDAACEVQDKNLLISNLSLKQQLLSQKKTNNLKIISVIEEPNVKLPFNVHIEIPFSRFNANDLDLDEKSNYIIVCNRGITSYTATKQLKQIYPEISILSLEKGILGFKV